MIFKSEQEWLNARQMRFTASEIHKLMGKSRSGSPLSKTGETFVYEKAAEILTGLQKETFGAALDWGKQYESMAFDKFKNVTFEEVEYYGGETHVLIPYTDYSGYSPDALGGDFIVEIKCPFNSGIHLKNFKIYDADSLKEVHPDYYWQMQLGLIATANEKGYFVSYDPRFEGINKQLHIAEIERHDVEFEIKEKLDAAVELLNTIV